MARYTAPMKPGTGISDFAAPGGKYSVIYRGDTGKRWVLEILHRNVPMPGKPVIEFDYNTFEIVPDKNAKEMVPDLDALVAGVREALVATVGLQIKADSEHIRILDILAQGLMLEDIWIKGPILRRTMKDLSPERGERLA